MTLLDGSIEARKIIQVTSDTGCSNICWYLLINSNTPLSTIFFPLVNYFCKWPPLALHKMAKQMNCMYVHVYIVYTWMWNKHSQGIINCSWTTSFIISQLMQGCLCVKFTGECLRYVCVILLLQKIAMLLLIFMIHSYRFNKRSRWPCSLLWICNSTPLHYAT